MVINIDFCQVTDQHVREWWSAFDNNENNPGALANGIPSQDGTTMFLFGHLWNRERGGNPQGRRKGTVQLDNNMRRIVFPMVNARTKSQGEAKNETEDPNNSMKGKLKRGNDEEPIPQNRMQRKPNIQVPPDADGHIHCDGYWVCISTDSLMNNDEISFGGTGAFGFKTDADMKIHK